MLSVVYNMLCLTLGEPVSEFTYAFRTKDGRTVGEPRKYTPKEFYEATVGGPLKGSFIMVMKTRDGSITRLTRWSTTATLTTDRTGSISICRWTT